MASKQIINVNVLADTSQFTSAMKGINGTVTGVLGSLGRMAAGAVAAAGAAGIGALTASLTTGFKRLSDIENATAKLEGLGHSAESVKTVMESALASVKGTAYGLGEAATIAASAIAAGIQPGQELTKYLTLTADAASIAGTSLEEMGRIFNKVRTIGAAYNDSLQELADRGIPIYQWLSEQLGVTTADVQDFAKKGQISAQQFEDAVNVHIAGAALKAGDTVKGSFANMQVALARLGAGFLGVTYSGLPEFFTKVTAILDKLLPVAQKVGATFGPVLLNTFSKLADVLAVLLPPLFELLNVLLIPLTQIIKLAADALLVLITAFMPLIKGVLPPIIQLISDLLPPFLQMLTTIIVPLTPAIVKLVEAFRPLINAVLVPLMPIIADLIVAFIPLLVDVIPPLTKLIIALVPVIFALIKAFLPLLEVILPILTTGLAMVVEIFAAIAEKVGPGLVVFFQVLGKILKPIVDYVLKPFLSWVTDVYNALMNLLGLDGKSVNVNVLTSATGTGASVSAYRSGGMKLATGGLVMPTPGGVQATIAEAGQAEAVIPLDRLEQMMGGGRGTSIVIQGNVGWSPEDLANIISRKQRQAYALNGLNGIIGVR